jgi:SAM-dependent methyltransferase
MTPIVDVPAAYDLIADKFLADRSRSLREKSYLERALAGARPGAKVLDFGCGTGRPIGEYLVAAGFSVTGVDGSARMLEHARRFLPATRLIQARLEEVDLPDTFAAAVAWDSLFHVDRRHHAVIYQRLARWIAPGGGLLLTSGGTEDPGFTDQMHGESFYYSSWSPATTTALLEQAGFEIECREIDQPAGRGHLVLIGRRRSEPSAP